MSARERMTEDGVRITDDGGRMTDERRHEYDAPCFSIS